MISLHCKVVTDIKTTNMFINSLVNVSKNNIYNSNKKTIFINI